MIILALLYMSLLSLLLFINTEEKQIRILGESHNVVAYDYTNNTNKCLEKHNNFVKIGNKHIFTGIKWECVEFVRRFLLLKKGIIFSQIDYAYQLWYNFENIRFITFTNSKLSFQRVSKEFYFDNIFNTGDILVWEPNENLQYGHTAVIVGTTDYKNGYYMIAEQNWEEWNGKDYSLIINIYTEPFLLGIIKIVNT